MARMPAAQWIGPTPNLYPGGMSEHRGLVLHIQDGGEAGTESWFKDPSSQASSHFLNPKSGGLRQLVDTDDAAWTEMAGNRSWVSVENEGLGGDSLTASQIENCAQLLAWLHGQYGIPVQPTDDPNGTGLGWHGMGGAAWGGHYDCPGNAILAQRPAILARAAQLVGQPAPSAPKPPAPPAPPHPAWPGEYLSVRSPMLHDNNVQTWQRQMAARGWSIAVDGWYGPASAAICRQFQQEKGLGVDGIVGPVTWNAAWTAPVTN
ncbi:hypothetical protein P3T36_006907 [Kitasatospora sp. MAP12-15]|uniref:peptidoglycan recognition protein family protein n=1 Tax=unclassified Kitasatospora TaxID=2633591 RepID=UPI002473D921|nr:peptidoglycan-binding domain-containing protein [Kitasatospora sp. MAP12-44]MDH6111910.1 hypothetical protein [Kitasatospora sp. MAP12-44]